MCDERFERTLVGHGNDAALDAAAKQFAGQLLPLGVVEGGVALASDGFASRCRETVPDSDLNSMNPWSAKVTGWPSLVMTVEGVTRA